ncbi:P-loop containing nucleoside triphosphate hydrolase protein [Mycena vitilis]|nr:P-loop containing nucleoside triphosphate hydrolase protein [Mycena vitilis]
MRCFRREVGIMAALLLLRVLTTMSGPFAMNRLLQYIETQDQGAIVRPWVWILIIVLGPVVGSITFQFYLFISTRSLVRAEAIITQLVFAHSLRIRVKAETTATTVQEVEATPSATPTASTASTSRAPTPSNPEDASRSSNTSPTVQGSVTSSGKLASVPSPSKPAAVKAEPSSGGSLVGKINNLVTVDLSNITDSRELGHLFIVVPLQIVLAIWFLYVILGWSVWVGVASIVLLAPVPGYMAKLVQSVQKERLKRTDERVQAVSEAVNVLRMVKLFGWEEKMNARIGEKRDSELVWIRKKRVLDMISTVVKYVNERCNDDRNLWNITVIMGQSLNASKVFSSMTMFDILRDSIAQITHWLNDLITGKVSLDRLNEFLKNTELLDNFDEKNAPVFFAEYTSMDERIGFRDAAFSWSKEIDESSTPSQRQFLLRIDGEILFERGRINLVVGPTGSGKTSLLMALLGEMHWIPSSPDSWYNLPRGSGVAYAAQESWVLNETIRSNIVFDSPFDEERYKKVLYQCALEPDIVLFQAGDQSEVGERGLTLSGGQKARLTLARAVYSGASILLLDDVLAALDVHTAQWIVEKCFGGDLIENRTVILVTHNVALARPIADFVVTFGSDGRVRSQGTISELTKRGPLAAQIRKEQQALDDTRDVTDLEDSSAAPADGKLIVAEEIQLGHVGASAVKMYFFAVGGKYPLFFFTFFLGTLLLQQVFGVLRTWILGYWATQYDQHPAEDVNVVFFLSVFVAIAFFSTVAMSIAFIFLVFGQLRASKVIHTTLLGSVFSAPLRWLDITPTSRILARATNDVRAIDVSLPATFWPLAYFVTTLLIKFVAVLVYTPIFFIPGALVGALGAWVGQIFIAGQLPVKRLMSNARAPVLAHFTAAMAGLVSIRAFDAESKFSTESLVRIDRYTRAARNYYNLDRWVGIRIDMLGSVFFGGLAVYLVYIKHTGAGDTGFVLNMSIAFTQVLLWVVRSINNFEVQGNSLERIQAYIDIEHEKPATDSGKPPAYWPTSGELRVEGLSARYSDDGPKVLHDISFHIKSGERIGIVGRTGSGKSSLTLSLLRCIPTSGSVMYDGLETSELNLDALRSSIAIIPQVPELLSGTLRANLNPFGQYDDAELNDSLRAAGLFALQDEMDEGRITLDSAISTGGSNLSIGQRQIFALARAILRRSKILILDEATSAIDYKTDSIIQNSLRHELRGDVSLITVAHRLQTIMDADKIMVLDAGRIVEFDSPKKLLKIKDGKLRALVEESGDRDALYVMAGAD